MEQIKEWMNKYTKMIAFVEGITTVSLLFFAWCLATISYKSEMFGVLHIFVMMIAALSYICCIYRVHRDKLSVEKQMKLVNVVSLVVFLLIGFSDIFGEYGKWYYLIAEIIWIVTGILGIRILDYGNIGVWNRIKNALKENWQLFILLGISFVLAIEPFKLQFRWDGALYEQVCHMMNIHSLSSLGAYGHLSQGYGSMYYLLYILTNHTEYAMAILNTILYLSSIVGFYLLTRQLDTGKQKVLSISATVMYACSPFLLGMVNYYSLDYATLCLFVWVVYFAYTRKWILHFAIACCFIFTKEPALVVYGAFCFGGLVVDFIRCEKRSLLSKITYLLRQYQYYLMLLVGLMWVTMYCLIGGWSGGVGEFSVDFSYMIEKLKVLFVLNFNWLMVLTFIICLGVILLRHKEAKGLWERCIPIMFSLVMYTIFSAMFKTVNHARYAAAIPVILYLLVFWVVVNVWRKRAVYYFGIASVFMLLSSFITIDPVSLLSFSRMNTGSMTMITTGSPSMGDAMIYNKQMLRQEDVFNQALEYAINKEYCIYIPMFSGVAYSFDGLMVNGIEQNGQTVVTQFWDEERARRTAYEGERTMPFYVYEVTAYNDVDMDKKGCYIYSDILGSELAEQLKEQNPAIILKEFHKSGWTLYMLEF